MTHAVCVVASSVAAMRNQFQRACLIDERLITDPLPGGLGLERSKDPIVDIDRNAALALRWHCRAGK
jgi:hypothetical protein